MGSSTILPLLRNLIRGGGVALCIQLIGCMSPDNGTEHPLPAHVQFLPDEAFALREANQMVLIRDGNGSGPSAVYAFDLQAFRLIDSLRFATALGYPDLADNGMGEELYVPAYNGNVYILDPKTLVEKAVLPVGAAVYGAASDSRGNLFVSDGQGYLRAFRRANLEPIDSLKVGSAGLRLWTLNPNLILGITLFVEPRTFMLYEFKDDSLSALGPFSTFLEPYAEFGYSHKLLRVSPDKEAFITSSAGSYFTSQDGLRARANLAPSDVELTDFAFSADGNRIYLAAKDYRDILVYDRASLQIQGSVRTVGFPVMLASQGDELLCLTHQPASEGYRVERIRSGQ